jgi:hypothetical protein
MTRGREATYTMNGHWKLVLGIVGLASSWSTWRHHAIDYRKNPPTVIITGAARDSLNAAYAAYDAQRDSTSDSPYVEQGFCARSWTTQRTGWNTTVVKITSVVRSEANASPISVFVPCTQSRSTGVGIVFHTHPPQQCVVKGNWTSWSECAPTPGHQSNCAPSSYDLADTLTHPNVPARFVVCGRDRFVFYHGTEAL